MSASTKPLVAISACLLGHPVRYDGRDKRDRFIEGRLGALFEWLPLCPETAIGLPTPRPPLHLRSRGGTIRVVGVADAAVDVTDALADYARTTADVWGDVRGCILKARSPSCGLGGLPVMNSTGETLIGRDGWGEFARVLRQLKPDIPMIDEEQLRDDMACRAFVESVLR